jgi:hypothetical protein
VARAAQSAQYAAIGDALAARARASQVARATQYLQAAEMVAALNSGRASLPDPARAVTVAAAAEPSTAGDGIVIAVLAALLLAAAALSATMALRRPRPAIA